MEILKTIIIYVGVPAVLGAFIYVGKKLQLLENVCKTVDTTKYNIKAMANAMNNSKNVEFDHSLLQDYSPLQLSPNGEEYLKRINFLDVFNDNKKEFFKVIDLEEPTTKYDVEQASVKSVLALMEEDFFKRLKVYFYNNPKEDKQSFAKVAGVYVREEYLKEHQDIKE